MKYSWIAIVLMLCACASGPSPEQLAEQRVWKQQVFSHLSRLKTYPRQARAQGLAGQVEVEFTVDAQGQVVRQRILHNTGSALFVQAVQTWLSSASPLPAPPPWLLEGGEARVRAPFVFCPERRCPE